MTHKNARSRHISIASITALLALSLSTAGCTEGLSTMTAQAAPATVKGLHGKAFGGQQPVGGANIKVYAAGTTSYGVAGLTSTGSVGALSTTTTDGSGNFSMPAYTCPSGNPETYIVATGGNSGGGTNSSLALMAALGPCSGAQSQVGNINEVTTIGAVFALAPFMKVTSGTAFAEAIGTDAGNITGLTNAFSTVNTLVSFASGMANTTVAASNATVDAAKIYELADIIATCINSADQTTPAGPSALCNTLFTNTTATTPNAVTPADTIQAAYSMAVNPVHNVATLYTSASTTGPFAGSQLSAQPTDWTIGVTYSQTGSGSTASLNTPYYLAVDGLGNVYVANAGNATNSANSITVLGPTGAVLGTYYTNGTHTVSGVRGITIDANNNAWVTSYNNNYIFECNTTGITNAVLVSGLPNPGPYGIAADGAGNIWFTQDPGASGTIEATSLAMLSATNSYAATNEGSLGGTSINIAIDAATTPSIWSANYVGASTAPPSTGTGTAGTGSGSQSKLSDGSTTNEIFGYGTFSTPYAVAVDASENIWYSNPGGNNLAEVAAGTTTVTTHTVSGGLATPRYIAFDGAGMLWVANNNSTVITAGTTIEGSVSEFNPATNSYLSPTGGSQPGFVHIGMNFPKGIAVDMSGNVWVANSGVVASVTGGVNANSVTELVGAATPVQTPLAAGLTGGTGNTPAKKP